MHTLCDYAGIADVFLEVCLALAREQSLRKGNENTDSTDGINSTNGPNSVYSIDKDSQRANANMCSC